MKIKWHSNFHGKITVGDKAMVILLLVVLALVLIVLK